MSVAYGSTFILNNASIFRQQYSNAFTFSSTSSYRLDAVIQMSADSNTPFAYAIYLAQTGSPTNFTFNLFTGPSRGNPSVGSGCRLLWFGWSAFALSVANPLTISIDLERGISGSYELWVAAQNVTSPSVAGYLGLGATIQIDPVVASDVVAVGGTGVPSSAIPVTTLFGAPVGVDIESVNGGVQASGVLSAAVDLIKLKGVTIAGTAGVQQTSTNISSSTSTDPLIVKIKDGAGGVGLANVSTGGVLSTSAGGGGGGLTPVYITDSTGVKEVKISSNGSLAIVAGN